MRRVSPYKQSALANTIFIDNFGIDFAMLIFVFALTRNNVVDAFSALRVWRSGAAGVAWNSGGRVH